MINNVTYRHLDKAEKAKARQAIQAHADKDLSPLSQHFDDQLVRLHGLVERHTKRRLYRTSLQLQLPRKVLVAREEGEDIELVLRDAFTELARQLKKYKSQLNNEPLWQRPARRRQLREVTKGGDRREAQQALFRDLIKSRLKGLYNFVRREIAYLTASGELLPGQVTPDDVVDDVVVRAYAQQAERPDKLALEHWLRKLALAVLDEQVARRLPSARLVSLETPVEGEIEEDDEQLYEYYQPDEALRLEDLVVSPEASAPESTLARYELALRSQQLLAWLPRPWRQVVVLADVEGLSDTEIAAVMGIPTEMVAGLRQFAEAYLRAKLRDGGYTAPEEGEEPEAGWVLDPLSIDLPGEVEEEILAKFA